MLREPVYLDASALVKLLIEEPESDALAAYLHESGLQPASSEIAEIEVLRAVAKVEPEKLDEASIMIAQTIMLPLTSQIRQRAARLEPLTLRSLDAIHLATAIEIQPDLHSLLAYDQRLLGAASTAGIPVTSPG